jgi:hypothetical protein
MRLVIFKSEPQPHLRAFAEDPGGKNLPKQFAPWHAIGVVPPDSELPYKLDRAVAERAISEVGYQLWRFPKKKKPETAS